MHRWVFNVDVASYTVGEFTLSLWHMPKICRRNMAVEELDSSSGHDLLLITLKYFFEYIFSSYFFELSSRHKSHLLKVGLPMMFYDLGSHCQLFSEVGRHKLRPRNNHAFIRRLFFKCKIMPQDTRWYRKGGCIPRSMRFGMHLSLSLSPHIRVCVLNLCISIHT